MNLASEVGEPSSDVLFVNFNQVSTGLSVGTKNGYQLYRLEDLHDFKPTYECITNEDICIVERHFLSSLVAIVKLSSPRKLTFYNFNTQTDISSTHYANTILSVKLNRKIFVVCLEDSLHIHEIVGKPILHVIRNIPPNPNGLFALTVCDANSLIAYPGSSSVGDIEIFDATLLHAKITIPAHKNPLAALAFNEDGTKIASASDRGTVIRVFDVSNGETLFEFRRGVKRCVTIYSLSFSVGSEFICSSSNTETVHIFKLCKDDSSEDVAVEPQGWMETISIVLTHTAKYLPMQMSDVFTQQRSFATIQLPFCGLKNICCISTIQKVLHVFVASSDGYLYAYYLNTEGGPCTLAKQHRIDVHRKSSLTSSHKVAALSHKKECDRLDSSSKDSPESSPSNYTVGVVPLHREPEVTEEDVKDNVDSNAKSVLALNNKSLVLMKDDCLSPSVEAN